MIFLAFPLQYILKDIVWHFQRNKKHDVKNNKHKLPFKSQKYIFYFVAEHEYLANTMVMCLLLLNLHRHLSANVKAGTDIKCWLL